ncbi:MAG TPA: proton-conducting transporter membrane subunit, partial [Dehalococcoidia bacterium]|nr:proton-conducting transporter membrane subunit [Dehalococcoidia bacterium]
ASLMHGGGAPGTVFAGDLLTLVLGWELMALASAYLVITGGFPMSRRAGARYLFVHLVGGTLLLLGVLWHIGVGDGQTSFNAFEGGLSAWLVILGVAINAAIPPLHAWLADAYPEASVTGTVFLSAFTTKSAVYVLARGFAGWEVLVVAGVIMALYGAVYAVLENDTRRLLAYSIVSQVGFMVAAVGIGTQAAINGAAAHAFTHVIYKGLLLMGAGAVLYATGTSKMSQLGGLSSRGMRTVFALYMVGALSISAFPLFSGFVSKSMVIFAAEDEHLEWVAFLLYGASVGTFLHTGLKLPYFTWFGQPTRDATIEHGIPPGMYIAMAMAAILSIGIGVYPDVLYQRLPYPVDYQPYTVARVVHSLEFLALAGLGFWLFLERLRPYPVISLDTDWFYRKADQPVRGLVLEPLAYIFDAAQMGVDRLVRFVTRLDSDPGGLLPLRRLIPVSAGITLIILVSGLTVLWSILR